MRNIFALGCVMQSWAAIAQTADCEKIKNSDVPYTITQEVSSFEPAEKSFKEVSKTKTINDIYREDAEHVVSYSYIGEGPPVKTILKNGFTHKVELYSKSSYRIGTAHHASALTKDPRLDRKPFVIESSLTMKKNGAPDEITKILSKGAYVGQDKISVGSCVTNVSIYKLDTRKQVVGGELEIGRATVYFSPDLKYNVKTEVDYLDEKDRPHIRVVVQPTQINFVKNPERDQMAARVVEDVCLRTPPASINEKMAAYQAKQQGPELNQKFFQPHQGTSWKFEFNNREYAAGLTAKGACIVFAFDSSGRRIKDYLASDYGAKFISSQINGKETRHIAEFKLPRSANIMKGVMIVDEINDYSMGGTRISVVSEALMGNK